MGTNMKLKKTLLIVAVMTLMAGASQAQTGWRDRFSYQQSDDKFFANEFTLDAFGTYNKAERNFDDVFEQSWRHGDFGGGLGLNYFLTRNLGLGVDTYFNDVGVFAKNFAGSAILRWPLGQSGLSPYAFGGGGRRFSPVEEFTYHAGAGLELRFNRRFGIFSDIRYTWADKTSDESLIRAGVRFGLNK